MSQSFTTQVYQPLPVRLFKSFPFSIQRSVLPVAGVRSCTLEGYITRIMDINFWPSKMELRTCTQLIKRFYWDPPWSMQRLFVRKYWPTSSTWILRLAARRVERAKETFKDAKIKLPEPRSMKSSQFALHLPRRSLLVNCRSTVAGPCNHIYAETIYWQVLTYSSLEAKCTVAPFHPCWRFSLTYNSTILSLPLPSSVDTCKILLLVQEKPGRGRN